MRMNEQDKNTSSDRSEVVVGCVASVTCKLQQIAQ